ncbi:hypothetical protein QYF36_015662 [Acer negundo]|nr:hypothetical protein QYF36_015662 [Acer negundo]
MNSGTNRQLANIKVFAIVLSYRKGLLALDFSHRGHENFVVDLNKEEMVIDFINYFSTVMNSQPQTYNWDVLMQSIEHLRPAWTTAI